MACSSIVQACLTSRRVVSASAPPEPLAPLHILALLELSGSQPKAARALSMHQSLLTSMETVQAVPPAWIEAQGLIPCPDQPSPRETLWLLLPEGRVLQSATSRHLIRILRQRVEKAGEDWTSALDDPAAGSEVVISVAQELAGGG